MRWQDITEAEEVSPVIYGLNPGVAGGVLALRNIIGLWTAPTRRHPPFIGPLKPAFWGVASVVIQDPGWSHPPVSELPVIEHRLECTPGGKGDDCFYLF